MRWTSLGKVAPAVLVLACGGVGADPLGLEAAVTRALKVNVGYQTSLLSVDQARNSLTPLVNWKEAAVSATEKRTSDDESTTTLGLSLPLFDQLGASASVDADRNAALSLSASPLAHSDTAAQNRITYEKAVLAASTARTTLETSVRKAWLAQRTAQDKLDVQKRQTALLETAYLDTKQMYEKKEVTLTEVRTALKDWTDGRATQTTLEKTLVKAKAALATLVQTEVADLAPLDLGTLQDAVSALGPLETAVTGTSSEVRTQALEVEAQRAKAEALWVFDPDLEVTGTAAVPASGQATWSGAVTLTLALGDWQLGDRALADRALDLALRTLEAQRVAARSTEFQAVLAVQAAVDTVDSYGLALTQARDLLRETQLLVKTGDATALDLENAELGVTTAEVDLFGAWADLYGARLDLTAARS